jgi:chloramphenicol-sensitive protein RarD
MTARSATPERAVAEAKTAVWAGAACYAIWGLFPLMFLALGRRGVDPWEATAERCFWAVFWAGALALAARRGGEIAAVLRTPRTLAWLGGSALAISINWLLFIWASTHGRQLESSLGFYINPLLNMAVGAVLFRERTHWLGVLAVVLATVGVGVQTLALGRPPFISLGLAVSFMAYGVIRKRVAASAQTGLFIECLLLSPLGLAYMLWLAAHGGGHLGAGPGTTVFLLLLGPATAGPLTMFAWAARRLPLSTLGFLQFLTPTLQFACALASGEPLTPLRAASFLFIWAGVAAFSLGAWVKTRDMGAPTGV